MLAVTPLSLSGIHLIDAVHHSDERGDFFKIFHQSVVEALGIPFNFCEEFFSISHRGVLRGMHFQTPPGQHTKIVTCMRGAIQDVVLDIRRDSPSFGQHIAVQLGEKKKQSLWIPPGFAHGFLSLQDETLVSYKTDHIYSPADDQGVHWNSFGMEWATHEAIVSRRDENHPTLGEYQSPF